MARISKIDWDIIDARVRDTKQARTLPTMSVALLWIVLDQYFPSLQDEILEVVTDGADDRGVDAIHIVESEDRAEIYLFQSKYRESVSSTDKTINDAECLRLVLFIEELFDKAQNLERSGNFRLREAVNRIWSLHKRGIICRYQLVFCSNDQGVSHSGREILRGLSEKHQQVSFEVYGARELIRDLASRGARRETGSLQVISKEIFERADGDVRGVIASVDARSFVKLIQSDDGQSIKRYLFDDNLRVFLGANGGYNPEIIGTATSSESHLFWYLNNGITITCRNYSFNRSHANPTIRVEDFQIVNGAQTSHSLIEASRLNPSALEDVVLMVRVYATDREDVAERVAVATNSQARIQGRDLKANKPVMKKIELALAERGYFFERKRLMHADKPASKRIDALKLGQIILAYYIGLPDRSRAESDSIFDDRFDQVYHEGYDADELCALIELYRTIESMREDYISANYDNVEGGGSYQYLIYGHWFVLFVCRLIIQRIGSIPPYSEFLGLIDEAVTVVARACSQQKAVAHYQMFRSPKTKDKIMAEFFGKQGDLFEYLISQ